MGRAERRHHRRRIKRKRSNYWGYGKYGHRDIYEMSEINLGIVVKTTTTCSCYMCGNQRHNTWQSTDECLTMQERKANDNFKDSLELVD